MKSCVIYRSVVKSSHVAHRVHLIHLGVHLFAHKSIDCLSVVRLCRAKALAQAAGKAGDAHSVPAGTYVEVHVANVSTSAAATIVQRVSDSLQVCEISQCS